MKERCYIAGGGDCREIITGNDGFVIAADSGYEILKNAGIAPDLIIGDFDSLGYTPGGENVIVLPREKDDTDISVALKEGMKRGCKTFFIFGGTGGRPDHTFANYQLLSFISQKGCRGFLMGNTYMATVLNGEAIEFEGGRRGRLSVFALDENCEGVTLKGVKYPLDDAKLSNSFPLGVSNEFNGEKAEVSIKKGSILIMWEDTAENVIRYQSSRNFLPFSS